METGTTTTTPPAPPPPRQELIKAELNSEQKSLTRSDRKILKSFFGFAGFQGGRGETRKKADACLFVKDTLFLNEETEEDATELSLEEVMEYIGKLPSIFSSDKKEIQRFLENDGLELEDRAMCAVIRSFQVTTTTTTTTTTVTKTDDCSQRRRHPLFSDKRTTKKPSFLLFVFTEV